MLQFCKSNTLEAHRLLTMYKTLMFNVGYKATFVNSHCCYHNIDSNPFPSAIFWTDIYLSGTECTLLSQLSLLFEIPSYLISKGTESRHELTLSPRQSNRNKQYYKTTMKSSCVEFSAHMCCYDTKQPRLRQAAWGHYQSTGTHTGSVRGLGSARRIIKIS
jgi:hypothetical protein